MPLDRIPQRLKHVQDIRGVATLKEFHERLGGEEFVSYGAVRNYHFIASDRTGREPKRQFGQDIPADERVAPAPYLAAVARTFDVRLEWLVTGEGPVTEEEYRRRIAAESDHEEARELWEEVPFLEGTLNASAFLSAWLRLQMAKCFSDIEVSPTDLAGLVLAPAATLGMRYRPLGPEWDRYLHAMLHAITLLPDVAVEARHEGAPDATRSAVEDLAALTIEEEANDA